MRRARQIAELQTALTSNAQIEEAKNQDEPCHANARQTDCTERALYRRNGLRTMPKSESTVCSPARTSVSQMHKMYSWLDSRCFGSCPGMGPHPASLVHRAQTADRFHPGNARPCQPATECRSLRSEQTSTMHICLTPAGTAVMQCSMVPSL